MNESGSSAPLPTDHHVAHWQLGDESSFEILYRRFAPLLAIRVRRSRIWPALEGRMQLDDVVQEIWARALPAAKKRFKPSGPGSFLAFLGKIADRALVDLLRARSRGKRGGGVSDQSLDTRFSRDGTRLPDLAEVETPTSRARVSELEEIAQRELSPREFEAWNLVELQDYTGSEAGLAMDCSDSAIRGLLLRGRAKLVIALDGIQDPTNGGGQADDP